MPPPPPMSATLLKSVVFPPSRHHLRPSPLVYAADAKRTLLLLNCARTTTTRSISLLKSAEKERGNCWWTRPLRYAPPPPLIVRRWAASGGDKAGGGDSVRAQVTGSFQQCQSEDQQEEEEEPQQGLLTLPTVLTLGRVAAVPLLVSTFYMNGWWATTATTCIFVAAAITDWLDGYIARKMQLRTIFGAFLDPVADKLMVATTLVLLCSRPLEVAVFGEVPWLLTVPSIAIIGREITMSAVREWAASQDSRVLEAVAVSNMGKWKTATQMIALTILLATRDSSLTGTSVLAPSGMVLLYISAGLAMWSLVVYMRKIWRILLK